MKQEMTAVCYCAMMVDTNIVIVAVIVIILGVNKPILSAVEYCFCLYNEVSGVQCCFWAPSALIVWLKTLFIVVKKSFSLQ